jgi:dolichol-phosphate mannosyltransferase
VVSESSTVRAPVASGSNGVGPVWVILPTYNEAGNIERVVGDLLERLPDRRRILIVDDSSPDGTGEIADRLAAEDGDVEVLHRPHKEGLGPACIAGFAEALSRGAELVVEMDSDLSHDPKYVPELLLAASDADLVLGSRYIPGGGVTEWGLTRRVLSKGGNFYARNVLGTGIRDLTGGFKCYRRETLEAIDLDTFPARGYIFQVETTFRALHAGLRVAEVPILFRDRQEGKSKMSRRIIFEGMWRVLAMRLGRGAPGGAHIEPRPRKAMAAGNSGAEDRRNGRPAHRA